MVLGSLSVTFNPPAIVVASDSPLDHPRVTVCPALFAVFYSLLNGLIAGSPATGAGVPVLINKYLPFPSATSNEPD